VQLSDGFSNVIPGQLVKSQYRGGEYRLHVKVGNLGDGEIIEARSRAAPTEELVYVHLPPEAIHVIPQSGPPPLRGKATEPLSNQELTPLKEEIA
jgi:hypothetical protein